MSSIVVLLLVCIYLVLMSSLFFFFLMMRRPPRSTQSRSSAASDVYKSQIFVTPRLVRPLSASEVPPYPGALENNNPTDLELFLLGSDRQIGSRGEPNGSVGLER
eukprot:TRINITY_DN13946_c0_g1_i1.p1 TRINITY_DN13946_c0_g1~~TRINITY_DN13946_c0_g1_i1.p1  ORF type:complete len:105 (+),score=27.00 TRINITY_DN13946_c0_g1_i1:3-317(+)